MLPTDLLLEPFHFTLQALHGALQVLHVLGGGQAKR
jgi:hypothetical protein